MRDYFCPVCGHKANLKAQTRCYCSNCDLEFYCELEKTPPAYYQEHYQTWNVAGVSLRGLTWGHKQALRLAQEYLPTKGCLLDIGCAEGLFVDQALRQGWQAWGIDINPELIKISKSKRVYCSDLEHLKEHLSQKFDIITLIDILEHLHDPKEYLARVKDHLAENGLLFISSPNRNCRPKLLPPEGDQPPHHLTWWSKKSLYQVCRLTGYQILASRVQKVSAKDMAVWLDYWLELKIKTFKSAKSQLQRLALEDKARTGKWLYLGKKLELNLLTMLCWFPAFILSAFGGKGEAHCLLAKRNL